MFIYVSNCDLVGRQGGRNERDSLSVFHMDEETGAFELLQTVIGMRSPTYMVRNPRHPVLYVAERSIKLDKTAPGPGEENFDAVASFLIDEETGVLTLASRTSTGGESPMHLNVNPSGTYLFVANPGAQASPDPDAHLTVIALGSNGLPETISSTARYSFERPLWRERNKPYPHSVFGDTDFGRVFVPQLMTDRVSIYDFDAASGALTLARQPYVQVSSGAGPRHLAFHPSGKYFYVVNSFDATLSAFAYDKENGLATVVQTTDVHPQGFAGKRNIAHAIIDPAGTYLYCMHRASAALVTYRIDQKTGALTLSDRYSTLEAEPRDFTMLASGRMVVVGNMRGDDLRSFHVDPQNGALTPTGHGISTWSPNCVVLGPEQAHE